MLTDKIWKKIDNIYMDQTPIGLPTATSVH